MFIGSQKHNILFQFITIAGNNASHSDCHDNYFILMVWFGHSVTGHWTGH